MACCGFTLKSCTNCAVAFTLVSQKLISFQPFIILQFLDQLYILRCSGHTFINLPQVSIRFWFNLSGFRILPARIQDIQLTSFIVTHRNKTYFALIMAGLGSNFIHWK